MSGFVNGEDLDWYRIHAWCGQFTSGDEDYDVFKCPVCGTIYLIESEGGTVFLTPHDPARLMDSSNIVCRVCAYPFADGMPIIGPRADATFRVSQPELHRSPWWWIAARR